MCYNKTEVKSNLFHVGVFLFDLGRTQEEQEGRLPEIPASRIRWFLQGENSLDQLQTPGAGSTHGFRHISYPGAQRI